MMHYRVYSPKQKDDRQYPYEICAPYYSPPKKGQTPETTNDRKLVDCPACLSILKKLDHHLLPSFGG